MSNAEQQTFAQSGQTLKVKGGTQAELVLELPAGKYNAEWINTKTGSTEKPETFSHGGGTRIIVSTAYSEDIALRVMGQHQ